MPDHFTPLEQAAWGGFLLVHGRLMRGIDADLQARFRITHAEFEVLLRLSWAEGRRLRIQDLAAQSLLTRSGISRVVDRLVQAGWVARKGAVEDRRGAYAVLTSEGRARFPEILGEHVTLVRRQFLAHFSADELEQLAWFWQRIVESSDNPPQKPGADASEDQP